MQSRGKILAPWSTAAALLVVGAVFVAVLFRESPQRPRREALPAAPEFQAVRFELLAGEVPVVETLRFLGYSTGLVVLPDPAIHRRTVTVEKDIPDVDAEVVRSLLEANGFDVGVDQLANGRAVLRVEGEPNSSGSTEAAELATDEGWPTSPSRFFRVTRRNEHLPKPCPSAIRQTSGLSREAHERPAQ